MERNLEKRQIDGEDGGFRPAKWAGGRVRFLKQVKTEHGVIPEGSEGVIQSYYRGFGIQTDTPRARQRHGSAHRNEAMNRRNSFIYITEVSPSDIEYLGHEIKGEEK